MTPSESFACIAIVLGAIATIGIAVILWAACVIAGRNDNNSEDS